MQITMPYIIHTMFGHNLIMRTISYIHKITIQIEYSSSIDKTTTELQEVRTYETTRFRVDSMVFLYTRMLCFCAAFFLAAFAFLTMSIFHHSPSLVMAVALPSQSK